MQSKNHILITGLMRRPDILARSLQIYIRLKEAGLIDRIIISTWASEIEAFRQVALPLLAGKPGDTVILVIAAEPNITITPAYNGSFMHQSILRERGLELVPRQDWVLKTRTDFFIAEAFLVLLLSRIKRKLLPGPQPNPLSQFTAKVWVPWMHITSPFYLEDMCHFGRKRDLALMHNFDIASILHAPRTVNVHQTLYYRPFRDRYDIFYEYFKLAHRQQLHYDNDKDKHGDPLALDLLDLALDSPAYLKLLALYWKLVFANFFIHSDGECHGQLASYPGGGEAVNWPYTQASIFSHEPRDLFELMRRQRVHVFAYNSRFICRDSTAFEQLFEASTLAAEGEPLLLASLAIDQGQHEADEPWLSQLSALCATVHARRMAAVPG